MLCFFFISLSTMKVHRSIGNHNKGQKVCYFKLNLKLKLLRSKENRLTLNFFICLSEKMNKINLVAKYTNMKTFSSISLCHFGLIFIFIFFVWFWGVYTTKCFLFWFKNLRRDQYLNKKTLVFNHMQKKITKDKEVHNMFKSSTFEHRLAWKLVHVDFVFKIK